MAETPNILYGTAWKSQFTAIHVQRALESGFRGIDTAGQPRHYDEKLAGEGIAIFLAAQAGKVTRKDLFIQSKFTFESGQDPQSIPYNPKAPSYTEKVNQSFASTLKNLRTDYIDSYVLHGPYTNKLLHEVDFEVWKAMEALVKQGSVKRLGVSNINLEQLVLLFQNSEIKPSFVQNRCYAVRKWDKEVRDFCKKKGIVYQGFSLLTANTEALRSRIVEHLATQLSLTRQQLIFLFAREIGMLPLSGTTSVAHMTEDIAVMKSSLALTPEDLIALEECGLPA